MKKKENEEMFSVITLLITLMFLLTLCTIFSNVMLTNRIFSIRIIISFVLIALGSITVGGAMFLSVSDMYLTIKEALIREIGFVVIITILYFFLNTNLSMFSFNITDNFSISSQYFMIGLVFFSAPILFALQRCQENKCRGVDLFKLELVSVILVAIVFFFSERLPLQFSAIYIITFASGFFYTISKCAFSKLKKNWLKIVAIGIPLIMMALIVGRNRIYIYSRLKTAWSYNSASNSYWGADYRVLYDFIKSWDLYSGVPDRTINYDVNTYLQWRTDCPMLSIAYFTGWCGVILYIMLLLALLGILTFILLKVWNLKKSNHVLTIMAITFLQVQILLSIISGFFPLVNVPAIVSSDTFFIVDMVLFGIILDDICKINEKLDCIIDKFCSFDEYDDEFLDEEEEDGKGDN